MDHRHGFSRQAAISKVSETQHWFVLLLCRPDYTLRGSVEDREQIRKCIALVHEFHEGMQDRGQSRQRPNPDTIQPHVSAMLTYALRN
ncbi:hypothetical protein DPMN_117016 [Dreissena polymorpha]|uniref:Uncharacterized protein n=1 Tax=Dreissena polymorpha TaxID=45954 RepID=A0A9D4QUT0_DREPO|nr:hypothetical protein DPMN_117016 [Dreissena polymorpha]